MLQHVLRQRLEREWRELDVMKRFGYGYLIADARAEAGFLDFEIVAHDFEFLAQRNQAAVLGVEREAEQGGELADGILGASGVGGDERGDGVESVEEKVRVNTGFER